MVRMACLSHTTSIQLVCTRCGQVSHWGEGNIERLYKHYIDGHQTLQCGGRYELVFVEIDSTADGGAL